MLLSPRLFHRVPAVAESVSIKVSLDCEAVIEPDRYDTRLPKCLKLAGVGLPVVIPVGPQPELAENRVRAIDDAVGIAAAEQLVILRQCFKSVECKGAIRQTCVIAEQLTCVVNPAVAI